ncbi:MAG: hypothetical protein COV73_01860 [Candidatus Omnitrophica bacterium CG11_big_fil_rev_8_21_14_0_20_43_6]|nr:MAG: hypothetical protein COV73_01860 [Candidatus Omnitrophica bacterium CG11_big_fil_rev_8_21_14_0_20_43_6]
MKNLAREILCTLALILFSCGCCWAQDWEKHGHYYYLTKENRDHFSLTGSGPNKFARKYLKYNGVDFLVRGASDWDDYGRLDLEGNRLFILPIRDGLKVEEVYLLVGGNYSNSYEHDGLMRLYGDKYFYATLSAIFVYQDGSYQEMSVPVFWDWFRLGPGEWFSQGARIKFLGENPVRKDCNMFWISFTNLRPLDPVNDILIMDSWIGDRPFSDVFAVTLKSSDMLESVPRG